MKNQHLTPNKMKWLKSLLFVLLLSVSQLSMAFVSQKTVKKNSTNQIYLSDTIRVQDCKFDTLRLTGKGVKFKGKRYYYTDSECKVVEMNPPKNNKGVWIGFLSKLIRKVFHI